MGVTSLLAAGGVSAVAGSSRDNSGVYSGVPSRYAGKFELHAVGVLTEPLMVWPWPPPTPLPPVPAGAVFKMSVDFPWVEQPGAKPKDVMQFRIFVVLPFPGSPEATISRAHLRADQIVVDHQPGQGNFFSVYGLIIANPDISPFGQLTGLTSFAFGNFDEAAQGPTDTTNFTLLGVTAAGSHATAAPLATGVLRLKGKHE